MRKSIPVLLFFFILFLTFSPFSAEARGLVPCGGNGEPVCTLCHLIIGIDGIIDWGFTILVFIAILVIVIAGIMYIISTGNEQEMEKAKNMVKQALTGAIIVFGAWLIVNTTITLLGPASTGITATGWSTFSCTPAVSEQIYVIPICGDGRCTGTETNATCQADCQAGMTGEDTCATYPNTNNVINFSTTAKTTLPSGCNTYASDFQSASTSTGVDIKILKAIAAIESTCGANLVGYDGLSCGIMHLRMSTAGKDCNWLKSHPKESIEMAAQYIAANSGKHGGNMEKIFAGYNGGFGATTSDGKLGAFANSNDCPGALAYQCCKNPGGLAGAQDYVFKGIKYYNYQ